MREVEFTSGGDRVAAWHWSGEGDELAVAGRRPCVVMAHGLSATRDSALPRYGERFAAAGLDVLVFDYRHFGDSGGEPRQLLSIRRQQEDYEAAVAFARDLDAVDPQRIVLWGSSFSGGHVVPVAARDGRVAAVVSQTPMMDGLVALRAVASYAGVGMLARLTALGLRDLGRALLRRPPLLAPAVGRPGSLAAMTSADAEPGFLRMAGPSWRNEVAARLFLAVGSYRPITAMDGLPCPILIQIAEHDSVAPVEAAEAAAERAPHGAEVRRYPIGHFDIYVGEALERSIDDQLHFMRRRLAPAAAREPERSAA